MYKLFFKRVFDFTFALVALICLSPLFLVVTIWLLFANKGAGAFFFQERPGKDAKIFKVIKFKSMTDERDAEGNLIDDEIRLTRAGKFVRSTSIDELPQLINILKGDMSLIGPRPLLPKYLPYYTDREKLRHTVRPGITGPATLKYRLEDEMISEYVAQKQAAGDTRPMQEIAVEYNDNVIYPDKVRINCYYYRHYSFIKDFQMILCTVLGRKMKYAGEEI